MIFRLFRPKIKRRISKSYLASRVPGVNTRRRQIEESRRRLRRRSVQDDELMAFEIARRQGRIGQYEDRRTHSFQRVRPVKGAVSVSHRLVAVPKTRDVLGEERETRKKVERVGFYRPNRVIICARRRMRREVLHAIRRTGSGGGAKLPKQKPRYNPESKIVCYGA